MSQNLFKINFHSLDLLIHLNKALQFHLKNLLDQYPNYEMYQLFKFHFFQQFLFYYKFIKSIS